MEKLFIYFLVLLVEKGNQRLSFSTYDLILQMPLPCENMKYKFSANFIFLMPFLVKVFK